MSSIGLIKNNDITLPSLEETVTQFRYMMTEKVKKDIIDKKNGKKLATFGDFICGVMLTDTNSAAAAGR